jgi:hypothetical protein
MAYSGMQINGSMEVSQENGDTTVNVANTQKDVLDSWKVQSVGTPHVMACARHVVAPANFNRSLLILANPGNATPAATDNVSAYQVIEGYRVARLGWGTASAQPITIGFWVATSTPGTYSGAVMNGTYDRSYVFSFASTASGFEYKTVTIPGDVAGTWAKDNTAGMVLFITLMAGVSKTKAAGAWGAGAFVGATGTTNGLAATNNQCYLSGVIVLPGVEAPSAARSALIMRPYDQELLTCQRYLQTFGSLGASPFEILAPGHTQGTTVYYADIVFRQLMRASPTMTYSALNTFYIGGLVPTAIPAATSSTATSIVQFTVSGAVSWQAIPLQANSSAATRIVADARL